MIKLKFFSNLQGVWMNLGKNIMMSAQQCTHPTIHRFSTFILILLFALRYTQYLTQLLWGIQTIPLEIYTTKDKVPLCAFILINFRRKQFPVDHLTYRAELEWHLGDIGVVSSLILSSSSVEAFRKILCCNVLLFGNRRWLHIQE